MTTLVESDLGYRAIDVRIQAADLLNQHGERQAALNILRLQETSDKAFMSMDIEKYQRALGRFTGVYERPPITGTYLNHKGKLSLYCRMHALTGKLGTRVVAGPIVSSLKSGQTGDSSFIAKQFVGAVSDLLGGARLSSSMLDQTSCWTIDNLPPLPTSLIVSCPSLTTDMIDILSPYCVQGASTLDNNECTALNSYLAETLTSLGPKADAAVREFLIEVDKLEDQSSVDIAALAERVASRHFSNDDEARRVAMLLLGAIGNDNKIPFFFEQYQIALEATGNQGRIQTLSGFSKEKFSTVIQKAGRIMNRNGVAGYKPPSGGAGVHHYLAGLVMGCELAHRSWDAKTAEWAGFMSGAIYEARDLVSHVQSQQSRTKRKSTAEVTPEELASLERRWIQNYQSDTSGHRFGARDGANRCAN